MQFPRIELRGLKQASRLNKDVKLAKILRSVNKPENSFG